MFKFDDNEIVNEELIRNELKIESDENSPNSTFYFTEDNFSQENEKNLKLSFLSKELHLNNEPISLQLPFIKDNPCKEKFSEEKKNDSDLNLKNISKKKTQLFNIQTQQNLLRRKRGRKSNNFIGSRTHSSFDCDNLLRKVQVHFTTFIISFGNNVLESFGYDIKKKPFFNIAYEFKKNVTRKDIAFYKRSNISYFLCQEVTPKFASIKKDANEKLFKEVTKNEIIKYLLTQNYLKFFKNVYYENKKQFSFKFGNYNGTIDLSNAETFYDLLKQNEGNQAYKNKLEKHVYKTFIKED